MPNYIGVFMHYVYAHIRHDTNEVFYIGQGQKERCYDKNHNKHWKNVVNKTGYSIKIIKDNLLKHEANELEILLIRLYGRKDLGMGNLVNKTHGGEGSIGVIVSDITKSKMSMAHIGDKNPMYGKPQSVSHRIKNGMVHSKPVIDQFGNEYKSAKEAAKYNNINASNITKCCKGKVKTAGKLTWRYVCQPQYKHF